MDKKKVKKDPAELSSRESTSTTVTVGGSPEKGHKGKRKRRTKVSREPSVVEKRKGLDIPGVMHVRLPLASQKLLSMEVGEDVTMERPWKWVFKDIIEQEIDELGALAPFQDQILAFPYYRFMMGLDMESVTFDDFYIAVTVEGQEAVQIIMARLLGDQAARVRNAINKVVGVWQSLGSEDEVSGSIVASARPFLEQESLLEMEGRKDPPRLAEAGPDDVKNGYLSLLPGRLVFKNVEKQRYDTAVQVAPETGDNEAQTEPMLPTNQWTQYLYEVTPEQTALTPEQTDSLKETIDEQSPMVEEELNNNTTLDLDADDYGNLVLNAKDTELPTNVHYREYESFIDVVSCKGLLVSAVTWHPMWTGLAAVAYAQNVRSNAVRGWNVDEEDSLTDEVLDAVYARNVVLVWCFTDRFKPKLYLESPREVHCLQFCPYNANIIVGGLVSGQIVVWDITQRIDKVEQKVEITDAQKNYRYSMYAHLRWMKDTKNPALVVPAAVSSVEFSHEDCVTAVQWLSPFWRFTNTGRPSPPDSPCPDVQSLQFLTCSEDGCVFLWDLHAKQSAKVGMYRPRRKRASRRRPDSLDENVSEFRPLHRVVRPHFRLAASVSWEDATVDAPRGIAVDAEEDLSPIPLPLADIAYYSTPVEYSLDDGVVRQPDEEPRELFSARSSKRVLRRSTSTVDDSDDELEHEIVKQRVNERKKYSATPLAPEPETPPLMIHAGTTEGDVLRLVWEGLDVNTNDTVNHETGEVVAWSAVHDGPIVSVARSPFLPELLLSVGGKVLALWREDVSGPPIYWKRGDARLTAAAWSIFRPSVFTVANAAGMLEVWDLSVHSHCPIMERIISGKIVTGICYHPLKLPDNVLAVGDYNGSLKTLFIPEQHVTAKPGEADLLRDDVNREVRRRVGLAKWQDEWDRRHAAELREKKAAAEAEAKKREEEQQERMREMTERRKRQEDEFQMLLQAKSAPYLWKQMAEEKWAAQREKDMIRVLLQKKHLDKQELLSMQEPVRYIEEQKLQKKRRQAERIRQKQEIFRKVLTLLFPEIDKEVSPPSGPDIRLDEEESSQELLVQYYLLLEAESLDYIKSHPFRMSFDWMSLLLEGKERGLVLDVELNQRKRRNSKFLVKQALKREARLRALESIQSASKHSRDWGTGSEEMISATESYRTQTSQATKSHSTMRTALEEEEEEEVHVTEVARKREVKKETQGEQHAETGQEEEVVEVVEAEQHAEVEPQAEEEAEEQQ